jgi:hypothetical protein
MRKSDAKTDVTVAVDGKAWRLVPSLANAGPRERVFVVTRTSAGGAVVQFGDGVQGARPPAGGTITVSYRSGAGAGGNTATVVFERAAIEPTRDQALWIAIRNRTRAMSFEFRERKQNQ